jgi:hypothetical protein
MIKIFLFLQLLDAATTVLAFKLGFGHWEVNPLMRVTAIQFGPIIAVSIIKFLGLAIITMCFLVNKSVTTNVIRKLNYLFTVVVALNIFWIIRALVLANGG